MAIKKKAKKRPTKVKKPQARPMSPEDHETIARALHAKLPERPPQVPRYPAR